MLDPIFIVYFYLYSFKDAQNLTCFDLMENAQILTC